MSVELTNEIECGIHSVSNRRADSEAAALRTQVKTLRAEIKDAKEALQAACASLADNWDRFEALLVEHEQLSQQETADKVCARRPLMHNSVTYLFRRSSYL